jgi:hypothetical protein
MKIKSALCILVLSSLFGITHAHAGVKVTNGIDAELNGTFTITAESDVESHVRDILAVSGLSTGDKAKLGKADNQLLNCEDFSVKQKHQHFTIMASSPEVAQDLTQVLGRILDRSKDRAGQSIIVCH